MAKEAQKDVSTLLPSGEWSLTKMVPLTPEFCVLVPSQFSHKDLPFANHLPAKPPHQRQRKADPLG